MLLLCFFVKKKVSAVKSTWKNQFHLNGNPTHPHFTQIISQGGAAQQADCASSNANGGYYSTISQPTHPLPWMHLQHPPHPTPKSIQFLFQICQNHSSHIYKILKVFPKKNQMKKSADLHSEYVRNAMQCVSNDQVSQWVHLNFPSFPCHQWTYPCVTLGIHRLYDVDHDVLEIFCLRHCMDAQQ